MKRPFKTWLVDEHADADTAVGDLARDVQQDAGFPSEGDRADLLRYLTDVWGADASFLACFAEAWRLYDPTCVAPGCAHPTGEGTSHCGAHAPVEDLL